MAIEKTEDQISRDKEAVAKMKGAQSAMEAAIRRISTLEKAVEDAAVVFDRIAKECGGGIYINAWSATNGDWRKVSMAEVCLTASTAARGKL